MSSEIISAVRVLRKKALELETKGHLLRAAEYYARASEAACALDPGADNFAALDMRRGQAAMLLIYCARAHRFDAALDPAGQAAHRAKAVALLTANAETLERRRVSGTLLAGKCTASEEKAWLAFMLDSGPPTQAPTRAPVRTAVQALVGYCAYIESAHVSLDLLANSFFYSGECSATQFEALAQLVVCAMDLLQLPRSIGAKGFPADCILVRSLAGNVPALGLQGLDPRLAQLLMEAWQRLLQSNVLVERQLLQVGILREVDTLNDKHKQAVDSALFAPGLRSCALASCDAREAHPQHFKACAACRQVVYCSREHQLADWPQHKAACKAARKTAASADEGAGAASGARA